MNQVRTNALFNVTTSGRNADVRDLDEQSVNHPQHLVINGVLRDAVTAFDHSKKYDEELNNKIKEL